MLLLEIKGINVSRKVSEPSRNGPQERNLWCSRDILYNDSWMVFRERIELILVKLAFSEQFLKKCRHFTSLTSFALTRHLSSDFQPCRLTHAISFNLSLFFEKLSLESDSSLLFSFSNISTLFQRLLPTDHACSYVVCFSSITRRFFSSL